MNGSEDTIAFLFDGSKKNENFSLENLAFYLSKLDISAKLDSGGLDVICAVETNGFRELIQTANRYRKENIHLNIGFLQEPEYVFSFYSENIIQYSIYYNDKKTSFNCLINPDHVIALCNTGCTFIELIESLMIRHLNENQPYMDVDPEKKESERKMIRDILKLLQNRERQAISDSSVKDIKSKNIKKEIFYIFILPILAVIIFFSLN